MKPGIPFKKKTRWQHLLTLVNFIYFWILRASFKWFLHVFTGKSEIERILDNTSLCSGGKVKQVELSLLYSKRTDLRNLPNCPVQALPSALRVVFRAKAITKARRRWVQSPLTATLAHILGYNQLVREVEWRREERYSSDNPEHEEKLLKLWSLLKPDAVLPSRITRCWTEIGFQGDNPSTDFRGMGILGLEQLNYLCEHHFETAMRIYGLSCHPKIGFPFAVAGISITAATRDLLKNGYLKTHFSNVFHNRPPKMTDFHEVYSVIFSLFADAWKNANPESVMEFNKVKDSLFHDLVTMLSDDHAILPQLQY